MAAREAAPKTLAPIQIKSFRRLKNKAMKKILLIIFLTISIIAKGQYYSIDTISYNPGSYSGTSVSISNDSYSVMIPLGFQFCFYGYKYDSIKIGSNGVISFKPYDPYSNFCNWEIYDITLPFPYSATNPGLGIFIPWQDLNPAIGGNITYSYNGVAPNRAFMVSFDNVPMDSCSKVFKGQAKLFETTNIIETHIAIKDTCLNWNKGRAVHGLEGPPIDPFPSTPPFGYGDFISGRNYPDCVWTATNEGTRFTPLVDVCSPLSVNEFGPGQNNFRLYPNPFSQTTTLEFDNSLEEKCILTLYNLFGQIMMSVDGNTSDKIVIERQNLPCGLYFFRLDTESKTIAKGKLIIE